MLTRDLLRVRWRQGQVAPILLGREAGTTALVEEMIAHWRAGIGQKQEDVEEAAIPLVGRWSAPAVGKGLQKQLLTFCTFQDPEHASGLRARAFAASALELQRPQVTLEAHGERVASAMGMDFAALSEGLYADLPGAAILTTVDTSLTARSLIGDYNMALCQGLILHARSLEVIVLDADIRMRRRLLSAMRFRRLLAQIDTRRGGELRLEISGPGSVLDQSTRYGVALAQFLPALACAASWRAMAEVDLPSFNGPRRHGRVELSDGTGLVGDLRILGHVPEELRDLSRRLAERSPGWRFPEPALLTLPDGDVVVPDLAIGFESGELSIELFHRWHGGMLARRLQQLARWPRPGLAIGVDRDLARRKETIPLLEHAVFRAQGFLFSAVPSLRSIQGIVERMHPSPSTRDRARESRPDPVSGL